MQHSIVYSTELVKTLLEINAINICTDCIRKNILRIIQPCLKAVNFARYGDHHRTSLAHFLNRGKWDNSILEKNLKKAVIDKVYQHSRKTGLPVQCIIDDTISSKTRPLSRAVHPMEAASDHMSHLKRQMDYGHQAIGVMLACGEMILDYAIILYDKTQSKIDLVCSVAAELPVPPSPGYLFCDNWYTCEKVVDMFISKGFNTISGLKTNRILYPCGIRVQLSKYAQTLCKEGIGVHKVTVGKRKYWIYRYDGKLNGIDSATVILSYPEKAFGNPNALRVFLCTNAALSEQEILEQYTQRWPIEVLFRETKGKLALNTYQIRSVRGIQRFWLMMSTVHFLCCMGTGVLRSFSD